MFRTVKTIFLGRAVRAEQALETENAAIIIEQKLREAETGHVLAKRGLATLITRCKTEQKALEVIDTRIADLESRIAGAVDAGKQELAMDAAKVLADLENERTLRTNTITRTQEKIDRIRLNVEKTHRRLIDLRQGMITAKAIETERRTIKEMRGDLTASSAIAEGEAVLSRLLGSDDPIDALETYDEIDAQLTGRHVVDRLAEAGFGAPTKVTPEDVLARFKAQKSAKKSA